MDVKTLCLGALTLGDASGYEIKKLFENGPFAYFYRAGFGSIYPALGALHKEGKVSVRAEEQQGRPDKKVYSLTDAGRKALAGKLKKMPDPDRIRSEAMVMFFLADSVEPEHLAEVYDKYLDYYRTNLECVNLLDDEEIPPHRLFTRGFGRAFYAAAVKYMEENRHLLLADDNENKAEAGR